MLQPSQSNLRLLPLKIKPHCNEYRANLLLDSSHDYGQQHNHLLASLGLDYILHTIPSDVATLLQSLQETNYKDTLSHSFLLRQDVFFSIFGAVPLLLKDDFDNTAFSSHFLSQGLYKAMWQTTVSSLLKILQFGKNLDIPHTPSEES
jgi:hypothetical protein